MVSDEIVFRHLKESKVVSCAASEETPEEVKLDGEGTKNTDKCQAIFWWRNSLSFSF